MQGKYMTNNEKSFRTYSIIMAGFEYTIGLLGGGFFLVGSFFAPFPMAVWACRIGAALVLTVGCVFGTIIFRGRHL